MSERKSEAEGIEAIRLRLRQRTTSLLSSASGPESVFLDDDIILEENNFNSDPNDTRDINPSGNPKSIRQRLSRKLKKHFAILQLNTKSSPIYDAANTVSAPFAILVTLAIFTVGMLTVRYLDARLPAPLLVRDLAQNPHSFIEERARNDLERLTSLGVRVTGSDVTDNKTVQMILDMLEDIRENHLNLEHSLNFEVQKPTGVFTRGSDGDTHHTSAYSKVANIVAKLEPLSKTSKTNHSILVNCHTDTKPGSPGATDDMISCVTMLEVIRTISGETPSPLKNSLIFLFNGAEELGLQGAHGFVKGYDSPLGNPDGKPEGHRWFRSVKTFLNLEGAGGGGRETLFQTGPGNHWTLKAYAKSAPHPYGVCIAEEMFQSGIIPSDTDFRIFRDYGEIPGLDMAFAKNGWVYHTKWDQVSEIPPGSLQHVGDNALAILKHLSSKVNFDGDVEVDRDFNSSGKMVYFDVFGLFMIYYPRWAGMILDCLVAAGTICSVIVVAVSTSKSKLNLISALIWLPVSAVISWILGVAVAALVALYLNGCGYYKPFYSQPFLAVIIFGVPASIAQILLHAHFQRASTTQTWMAQKMALALVLFVGTFFTRAVFIITINLIFSVISWHLTRFLCRGWPRAVTLFYLLAGETIPFLFSSYLLFTLSDVFVPILGRSGSETNANLFFGVITGAIVVLLIWSGFVFLFVQFRKRVLWISLLLMFFCGNSLLVFGFIGKVPYQEKTPMRLNMVHVDRTWYHSISLSLDHSSGGGGGGAAARERKTDAGYWIWPYDSNTRDFLPVLETYAPELEKVTEVKVDYEGCKDLYCAQPFLWPMGKSIKTTHWLPQKTGLPGVVKDPVVMTSKLTPDSSKNLIRVEFSFLGPPEIAVVLSAGPNYKLRNWTLSPGAPERSGTWQGRDTFFIYHARGMLEETVKFVADFEENELEKVPDKVLANVQYSAFYLFGEHLMTDEFRKLVEKFPGWTYTMPWTAVTKIYEITVT